MIIINIYELIVMILNINNQSNYLCNFEFKVAFTLAEVLITLLIVGIIASITIPAVIQNTNNAQHVTQLKKTYATLSQAFSLLKTENGGDISAVFSYPDSGSNSMNIFADKLNVIKKCGSGMGCWYTTPIKFLNGNIKYNNPDSTWNNQYGKAVLADGSILMMVRLGICNSNSGSG
jgi:prepilin-type N-terminal cleavage/methylation domain-containing protein